MDEKPWWNDADKIGGAAATFFLFIFGVIVFALLIKFIIWLFV